MSRTGDCWDNAPVESFFSSFKAEASPDHPWTDLHAATTATKDYMTFYNYRRLHSTLHYQSPATFEARLARHRMINTGVQKNGTLPDERRFELAPANPCFMPEPRAPHNQWPG